jgi:hypothetical protein
LKYLPYCFALARLAQVKFHLMTSVITEEFAASVGPPSHAIKWFFHLPQISDPDVKAE